MTSTEEFLKKYANLLDPKAKACQIEEAAAKNECCGSAESESSSGCCSAGGTETGCGCGTSEK